MALPQSANIVVHWTADDLALADNDPVASWTDSVSSIVAAQGTSARRPIYKTGIMGGRACVRFTEANDQYLTIATPGALATAIGSQTFSVMIVFQERATAGGYGTLFYYAATVGSGNVYYIADDSRIHRYPMRTGFASIPFTDLNSFTTFGNTSGVCGVINNAGTERAFINGSLVIAELSKAPGGTASNFYIGSAPAGFPISADIFEIVVWDVELTPPECLEFHDWACDQYTQTKPWTLKDSFLAFDGDSFGAGTGVGEESGSSQGDSYPYVVAQSLGLSYGQWSNNAVGYLTMQNMTDKWATDIAPYETLTGKPLKVVAFEWYNQRLDADPVAKARTYLSTVRSATVKVAFGTSTDSTLTPETARDTYNSAFDSDHSDSDAYVSLHTATHIGHEGDSTTYSSYFYDGLHLSATGYAEMAGLFVTGLNAITFGTTYYQTPTGTLTFSSGVARFAIAKTIIGVLSFSGVITKMASTVKAGALVLAGALGTIRLFVLSLSGSLLFTGAAAKTTLKITSGALTLSGTLNKLSGLIKAGALSFVGALGQIRTKLVALMGSLSFSGAMSRQTQKSLSGAATFAGSFTRAISKGISGVLSFAGVLTTFLPNAVVAILGKLTANRKNSSSTQRPRNSSNTRRPRN